MRKIALFTSIFKGVEPSDQNLRISSMPNLEITAFDTLPKKEGERSHLSAISTLNDFVNFLRASGFFHRITIIKNYLDEFSHLEL